MTTFFEYIRVDGSVPPPEPDRVDVALDPIPCPGHTTTFDSLWMGVPVVTLPGETAISRGGRSILTNAGLTNLIAKDTDHYVAIAARLAAVDTAPP